MSASLSLPTRAQLLELRRAGVTEYRRSVGDESILLTLRPLRGGRRPDEKKTAQEQKTAGWPHMNEAEKEWALLSRGQRRRRNVQMEKKIERSSTAIQRVARGMLAPTALTPK